MSRQFKLPSIVPTKRQNTTGNNKLSNQIENQIRLLRQHENEMRRIPNHVEQLHRPRKSIKTVKTSTAFDADIIYKAKGFGIGKQPLPRIGMDLQKEVEEEDFDQLVETQEGQHFFYPLPPRTAAPRRKAGAARNRQVCPAHKNSK